MNDLDEKFFEQTCSVCDCPMEYRPIRHWTGMRWATTEHRWECTSRSHRLVLMERVSEEFKDKEKKGEI